MSKTVQNGSGAHAASYSMGTAVFPGAKRPARRVDHSLPFSAEVNDEWIYTSTPSICLNGVDRESFIFF
jgi:hypothetical protein